MKNLLFCMVLVSMFGTAVNAADVVVPVVKTEVEDPVIGFLKLVKHRLHICLHGCPKEVAKTVKK